MQTCISYLWPLALALSMYVLTFCGRAIVNFLSDQFEFNLVARITVGFFLVFCFFWVVRRSRIQKKTTSDSDVILSERSESKDLATKLKLILFFVIYALLAFRYDHAEEQVHLVLCSLLFCLSYFALPIPRPSVKAFLVAFLMTMFVGVTEEILQYFVPGRYFDLRDIGTSFLGTVFGMLFVGIFERDGKKRDIPPV